MRRTSSYKKWSLTGLGFFVIFLIFFFFLSLANTGIYPTEAFKVFGYPGSHRNYLLLVRDPWMLNEDGGRVTFRANVKFRHGFFWELDFKNLPEAPDATLSINYIALKAIYPQFSPTEEGVQKAILRLFWKFWKYEEYARVIGESLAQKDFMIDNEASLAESSDFLKLTLENESRIPSDRYLQKRFVYQVDLAPPDSAIVTLRVHISHQGLNALPLSAFYTGLLRIAIPLKAEVLNRDASQEFTKLNAHIFEKRVEIPVGQSAVFSYRYRLPKQLLEKNRYQLFLYKQPSSEWIYQVVVKTPEDYELESSQMQTREFLALQEDSLDTDRSFTVFWKPTTQPLLLVGASLEKQTEIVLHFNRALSGETANDGLNYSITDLNAVYPEVTDQVLIRAVVFKDRTVRLKLAGMSRQPGEKYRIIVRNIRDKNGMRTSPDPLESIVAQ